MSKRVEFTVPFLLELCNVAIAAEEAVNLLLEGEPYATKMQVLIYHLVELNNLLINGSLEDLTEGLTSHFLRAHIDTEEVITLFEEEEHAQRAGNA